MLLEDPRLLQKPMTKLLIGANPALIRALAVADIGGESGSDLWRFAIGRLPVSGFEPIDFQFIGVAFYKLTQT